MSACSTTARYCRAYTRQYTLSGCAFVSKRLHLPAEPGLQGQTGMESLTPRYPFIKGNSNKRVAAFLSQQYMMHAQGQHMIQASNAKTNPSVGPMILHRQGLSVLPISIHSGKKNMSQPCKKSTAHNASSAHCRRAKTHVCVCAVGLLLPRNCKGETLAHKSGADIHRSTRRIHCRAEA